MSRHDKDKFPRYRRVKTPPPASPASGEKPRRNTRRDETPRRPPLEVRVSATERERKRRRSEEEIEAPAHPEWSLRQDADALALVEPFAAEQPFPLDPFQLEAAQHLAEGRSVLVAAPTGTGKTLVAEFGIWLARRDGKRAIYTAPLQGALQSEVPRPARALRRRRGRPAHRRHRRESQRAPIVVMTTEIYRNMLLEGAARRPRRPPQRGGRPSCSRRVDARTARTRGVDAAGRRRMWPRWPARAALDEELSERRLRHLRRAALPQRSGARPGLGRGDHPLAAHVTLRRPLGHRQQRRRAAPLDRGRSTARSSLVFHTERAVPLEHFFYLDGKLHLVQRRRGPARRALPRHRRRDQAARTHARMRATAPQHDRWTSRPRARRHLAVPLPTAAPGTAARRGGRGRRSAERTQPPVERQAPEPGEVLTALRGAGLLPCLYFLPGRRAVEVAAESAASHLLHRPRSSAAGLQDEVQRVGAPPAARRPEARSGAAAADAAAARAGLSPRRPAAQA